MQINQKGAAFLYAIMVSGMMIVVAGVVMLFSLNVSRQSMVPRIKSQMSAVESKVRATLMSPLSFSSCVSDFTDTANKGRVRCQLNTGVVTGLSLPSSNIDVPASSITMDNNFTDPRTGLKITRVSVKVVYTKNDFPIKSLDVDVDIPPDILQVAKYTCPDSAPIFTGYAADGSPKCNGFDARCAPGKYLKKVDKDTLAYTCIDLPSSVQCADQTQMISNINWNGGSTISHSCAPRANPFTIYGFDPEAASTFTYNP